MERVAREAGELVRVAFRQDKTVMIKHGDTTDLVTETDQAVEAFITARLRAFQPAWQVIGEETCEDPVVVPEDPVWIVDPIDGTTNFVHGFPEVGISIGLVVGRRPMAGVIYNPVRDQMFTAAHGHGAYCNGERLRIDQAPRALSSCLVIANHLSSFEPLRRLNAVPVHAIRSIGCATMNIAYVALGVGDVYLARRVKAWDIAAGIVLVREAGGVVIDFEGRPEGFDLTQRYYIFARNPGLAQEVLALTSPPAEQ